MSRDTWAGDYKNPITLANWLYANANPVMYVDPSGFCYTDPDITSAGYWENFWDYPYLGPCNGFVNSDDSQSCNISPFPPPSPEWRPMFTSTKGYQFIRLQEGFGYGGRLYDDGGYVKDATGHDIGSGKCTIGYGTLVNNKRCEDMTENEIWKVGDTYQVNDWRGTRITLDSNQRISKGQAFQLFYSEIKTVDEPIINQRLRIMLPPWQFDVLVSYLYNSGSTDNLDTMINSFINSKKKDDNGLAAFLKKLGHDKEGKTVPGIGLRREDEAYLYTSGMYLYHKVPMERYPIP